MSRANETQVAVIGAGPIGLELAIALKRAGISYVQFDGGPIGSTITMFPPQMRFFSSPERIALAGVPIASSSQSKCTKESYLAYLRSVVIQFDLDVRMYERVTQVVPVDGGFEIHSRGRDGAPCVTHAAKVVVATGGTAQPRHLGLPGEDLSHVDHVMQDPHRYFGQRVLVVGGKNSAIEAALRCWHAGAKQVSIAYRRAEFSSSVKYWLAPEINMLVRRGHITAYMETEPVSFGESHATLRSIHDQSTIDVPTDFVILGVGWVADMSLWPDAGVTLKAESNAPMYDKQTMETDVPGLYVAGTAVAGTQSRYAVFLENCHVHVDRIIASLRGDDPPSDPAPFEEPES